jgi:broad specificity phosphatase PhoE
MRRFCKELRVIRIDRVPFYPALTSLVVLAACATPDPGPPRPGALRIYLARHGQTDWNAEGRLQGSTDTTLNETGREQARALAARLRGIELDAIYSSELSRSRETAEIVAGGRPFVSLAGLNEQAVGVFEGQLVREVRDDFLRRYSDPDDSLDGGESETEHRARVTRALDEILAEHPQGRILIIGHGGTNSKILGALLDLSADEARRVHQANDELFLVELVPEGDPRLWRYLPAEELVEED